jgi:hypothetical protein
MNDRRLSAAIGQSVCLETTGECRLPFFIALRSGRQAATFLISAPKRGGIIQKALVAVVESRPGSAEAK